MDAAQIFNMIIKYLIFAAIIYLAAWKLPAIELPMRERIYITIASVIFFVLIEVLGGSFSKLKELICGCSTPTEAEKAAANCPTPDKSTESTDYDDSTLVV
jgi:hypothetical protein